MCRPSCKEVSKPIMPLGASAKQHFFHMCMWRCFSRNDTNSIVFQAFQNFRNIFCSDAVED